MSTLISITINYLGRFDWYVVLIKWLYGKMLELIGGLIVCTFGIIIIIVGVGLFLSAFGVIFCIALLPKYLSHQYDCAYFNWLFIISIPLGLLLLSALIEFTDKNV